MKNPMPAIAVLAFAFLTPLAQAQGQLPVSEQEQVQRDAQDAQNRANEHAMGARKGAQPKPFEELDLNQAGHLVLDDARRDAWLSAHFAQCDVDGDNKVSRAEYDRCTEKKR